MSCDRCSAAAAPLLLSTSLRVLYFWSDDLSCCRVAAVALSTSQTCLKRSLIAFSFAVGARTRSAGSAPGSSKPTPISTARKVLAEMLSAAPLGLIRSRITRRTLSPRTMYAAFTAAMFSGPRSATFSNRSFSAARLPYPTQMESAATHLCLPSSPTQRLHENSAGCKSVVMRLRPAMATSRSDRPLRGLLQRAMVPAASSRRDARSHIVADVVKASPKVALFAMDRTQTAVAALIQDSSTMWCSRPSCATRFLQEEHLARCTVMEQIPWCRRSPRCASSRRSFRDSCCAACTHCSAWTQPPRTAFPRWPAGTPRRFHAQPHDNRTEVGAATIPTSPSETWCPATASLSHPLMVLHSRGL
ncbi:hypothetical protein BU14_0079s0004 [Porphyra umbilicalis]|uniref:Uncharacterized protein n=1 Tax=Porphyra umbilicalis TaxID=2786 RepID=A0A1X6PEV3_PORUM|nr:hypothetical protein BU14_0079s0004 [Porphyra umbilicalis]|eukprot:OSX79360.1 hypothetical protein BU14_0079s0004 [Porphyra umbilicalis]